MLNGSSEAAPPDAGRDDEATAPAAAEAVSDTKRSWPWHPLQAIVAAVAIFIVSQLLAASLALGGVAAWAQLAGWSEAEAQRWSDGNLSQFMVICLAESLVIASVVWLVRRNGLRLRRIGFSRPKGRDALLAVLAFAVYYGLLVAVTVLLEQLVPGLDSGQKQDIGFAEVAGLPQLVMVFAALVIFAPVAEEVLFRGFLFSGLRQRWSFASSALVTSLIFGAAHLAGGSEGLSAPLWTAGIDTLLLSLVLCYLREKTGRLWAPVLLHAVKNGLAFYLLFIIQIHQ